MVTKTCLNCSSIITITHGNAKIFCSRSCSASFNNKKRASKRQEEKCAICNETMRGKGGKTFCSSHCFQEARYLTRESEYLNDFSSVDVTFLKNFLIRRDGYKCNNCGIDKWNEKPLSLDIEHKDGNSTNNAPLNLELLCPNCHSQTSTYKGRNKGNGRYIRRKRYSNEQSF